MKSKKILAVMLSFMMLVYTASDIAYAADSDLQDQNTEVTVYQDKDTIVVDDEDVIEVLPADEITEDKLSVASEEQADGDSDGLRFIIDIAVEAYDWASDESMKYAGFSRVEGDANLVNVGSTKGKYIYLGVVTSAAEALFNRPGDYITGLLIYKPGKPMDRYTLNPIEWNGKTYKPVYLWFDASDGNLNQDAGGEYLYLYYTNSGAREGDPALTGMKIAQLDDLEDYEKNNIVRDMNNPEKYQDMNEKADGAPCYLVATYHHHTPMEYDNDYHWCECEECAYTYKKEAHEFIYKPNPNSDGTHLVCCANERCDYEEAVPHIDKDQDGICDLCNAGCVAMVNGQSYSSFEGAWDHAAFMKQDATITLCEDTCASEEGRALYMSSGNTITIEGDGHTLKTCGSNPFNVSNGKLVLDTDIEYVGDNLNNLAYAYTKNGEICLKSGKITVPGENATEECSVLYADTGAAITATGGSIEITGPYKTIAGITIRNNYYKDRDSNTDTVLRIDNVSISGGYYGVSVYESKDILISDGTYNARLYGLDINKGAEVEITGGAFDKMYVGPESTIVISGGTFGYMYHYYADLSRFLKTGYCYTDEASGEVIYPEKNIPALSNVMVKKHEDHTGYVDENGICTICGEQIGKQEESEDGAMNLENASISGISENPGSMKKKVQDVKVILDGKILAEGTDYTVSYENGLKGGNSSVTITGMGEYTGSVTKLIRNNQGKDNQKKDKQKKDKKNK